MPGEAVNAQRRTITVYGPDPLGSRTGAALRREVLAPLRGNAGHGGLLRWGLGAGFGGRRFNGDLGPRTTFRGSPKFPQLQAPPGGASIKTGFNRALPATTSGPVLADQPEMTATQKALIALGQRGGF